MDAIEVLRAGEIRPVYGSVTLPGGTVTISSATYSLRNSTGDQIASGNVTGNDSGAAETRRAWLTLDTGTVVSGGLAAGLYSLHFAIVVSGSDSINRTLRPVVGLVIEGVGQTYTAWPHGGDVIRAIQAAGITLRPGVVRVEDVTSALGAVIDRVGRETMRQWIPASGTRYFDGSGSPELEIDEFTSLTSVKYLGWIGQLPVVQLSDVITVDEQSKPRSRILLHRGAAGHRCWGGVFPAGARNIEVTATWGYGATIPRDLWEAVRDGAAAQLAADALFAPGYNADAGIHTGRLIRWREGVLAEDYDQGTLTEYVQHSHRRLAVAIHRYRRPVGRQLRRARVGLI